MKHRRSRKNPFELLLILIIFMLLAIGNAAAGEDIKKNVAEEIQIARAENTLALTDIRRILANSGE